MYVAVSFLLVFSTITSKILDNTVTPEQLDHAKTLVLDLLGWGVEPEYLVDSGVSSGAIFRIFSDLRLRLPTNLGVVR